MALNDAYKFTDDQDIYYAEVLNQLVHSQRGNTLISGGTITGTANSLASPGTHANVSAGFGWTAKEQFALSSLALDLNTEYDTLDPDEGMYIYVYMDDAGDIQTLAGTKGDNNPSIAFFPPDFSSLPADCVLIGKIILAEGDTIIDSNNIKDLRVYNEALLQNNRINHMGSENAGYENLLLAGENHSPREFVTTGVANTSPIYDNVGSNDPIMHWQVPLPTNREGLALWLKSLRIYIWAFTADKFSILRLYGLNSSGVTQLDFISAEWNSNGVKTWDHTDVDVSAYDSVMYIMVGQTVNPGNLSWQVPEVDLYYG